MAFLNDSAYDNGLSWITSHGEDLHICSIEPATFAAVAGASLGVKEGITVGAPADAVTDGRSVTVSAISDGEVTATGTAAFWAVTDGTSVLVATGPLDASQAVTEGNPFTLSAITITLRDATVAA